MNLLPILRIHAVYHSGKRMRLWLPVCALWLASAGLIGLLLPVLAIALVSGRHREHVRCCIQLLPLMVYALTALRGFRVIVESPENGLKLQVNVV